MGVIIDITTHTGIGNGNFINNMRALLMSHARFITIANLTPTLVALLDVSSIGGSRTP